MHTKTKTFEDACFALNLCHIYLWRKASHHQFHLCNLRVAQHQTLYWKGSQERKEGQVVDRWAAWAFGAWERRHLRLHLEWLWWMQITFHLFILLSLSIQAEGEGPNILHLHSCISLTNLSPEAASMLQEPPPPAKFDDDHWEEQRRDFSCSVVGPSSESFAFPSWLPASFLDCVQCLLPTPFRKSQRSHGLKRAWSSSEKNAVTSCGDLDSLGDVPRVRESMGPPKYQNVLHRSLLQCVFHNVVSRFETVQFYIFLSCLMRWCMFRNAKSTALEVPIVRRKPAKLCRVRPDRHWPHLYSLSGWLNQKKSHTCRACHSNMAYPCSSGLSYTIFINIPVRMLVMLSCELDIMLFEQCLR